MSEDVKPARLIRATAALCEDHLGRVRMECLECRIAELEAKLASATALVRRASEDSCTTTSDDPGCFFCDHTKHTEDCPARSILELP